MTHTPWHPDDVDFEAGEELFGIESVELISIGIDIGTTTTHLLMSRLLARRQGGDYSSRFEVIESEIVYESPIRYTPYEDETTIATDEIQKFIERSYEEAGYRPEDIDTGAVITTGEASRKKNAEAITELFSDKAGKFVCATAGANLESLMASHGSGAVDFALDEEEAVLNLDVGGGTTKLAHITADGLVEQTGSINVGARLVTFDADGRLTKIEDAAREVMDDIGLDLAVGDQISAGQRSRLAERFADLIFETVEGDQSPLAERLMVTEPWEYAPHDVVTFSGGVSEDVYGNAESDRDDLGPELGAALRDRIKAHESEMAEIPGGIRATVLGSTQHSVQISGNTITLTDESVLPIRNVPIIPFAVEQDVTLDALTGEINKKLRQYDAAKFDDGIAFGFHLHGVPTYDYLDTIVDAAISGWMEIDTELPLILVFDIDVALNAGSLAADRVDVPTIAIDDIELHQFGYIDIGELIEETSAVPITVKSLIFEG